MVNAERWMEIRDEVLEGRLTMIERASARHGERLSRVGMLPDHIHLTLRCAAQRLPQDVALSYLNNLAYARGMRPEFKYGYCVGTIGEYDRGAAR
jgi:hypothetical protein